MQTAHVVRASTAAIKGSCKDGMVMQVPRCSRTRANRACCLCKYRSAQGLVRGWHVDLEVVQVLRRSRARADRECCSCKYRSAQGLVQGWHGSASTAVLKDLCKPRMLFVQVRWRSRARANRACCLCKYLGAQGLVQAACYHIVCVAISASLIDVIAYKIITRIM